MKVVKLNRRFRQYKDHGHTVALRFPNWSLDAQKVEKIASKRLGGSSYNREADWCGYFGHAPSGTGYRESRPYWITFRREADLTLVLLCADLTK